MKTRGKNWSRNRWKLREWWVGRFPLTEQVVDGMMRNGILINHLQNRLRQAKRRYATLHREIKRKDDEVSRLNREIERLRTCLLDTQEILNGNDPRPVEGVTRRL